MASLLKIPTFIAYGSPLGITELTIVDRLGIGKALRVHGPKRRIDGLTQARLCSLGHHRYAFLQYWP